MKDIIKKCKNICQKIWDEVDLFFYKIKSFYMSLRCWYRNCLNKPNLKFISAALTAYPFDYGYFDNVMLMQLKSMKFYFEKRLWTTDETYDEILKWLNIAIKCLEIGSGATECSLFHIDGDIETVPCDDHLGCYELKTNNLKYYCDVNVNLRNMKRFMNEKYFKGYLLHPHEFYMLKAKHLFGKIYAEKSSRWWD